MRTASSRFESRVRLACRVGLGIASTVLGACVSTSLDVPPDHPANPSAGTPPLPTVARALREDFDPDDLANPKGIAPHPGMNGMPGAPKGGTDGGAR